ncbi:MAG: tetratricopeptide repeat protein [Deferribacterales bacterium]
MKKFLLGFVLISVFFGALLYNYMSDESHALYDEAVKLYEQQKYFEAHEKVKEAMDKNILNRKAILLKAKLYEIVAGEENYNEASRLYEEAVNLAMQGNSEQARVNILRALELLDQVSSAVPAKEKTDRLIERISRDAEPLLNKAPDIAYRRAKSLYEQGNYRRAFENLVRLPALSPEGKAMKSSAAYKAGMDVYASLKDLPDVSNAELYDAIYWFEQVESGQPDYSDAAEKLTELRARLN